MTHPSTWTPDTRSNAQLQAQWRELQKEGARLQRDNLIEYDRIQRQMDRIIAELEERRVRGVVIT